MANTKSARKRAEKSAAQRDKNRAERARMRTAIKKARAAVDAGADDAAARVAEASTIVDKTARKGIVHANAAARTKSRLSAALKRSAG